MEWNYKNLLKLANFNEF